MPASLHARITRTAISPRLAIRTFCSGFFSGTWTPVVGGRVSAGQCIARRPATDPASRVGHVTSALVGRLTTANLTGYAAAMSQTPYELSREHEEFRRSVREFAEAEIGPHAGRWDREHHFPVDVVRR